MVKSKLFTGLTVLVASMFLAAPVASYADATAAPATKECACKHCKHCKHHNHSKSQKKHCSDCEGKK